MMEAKPTVPGGVAKILLVDDDMPLVKGLRAALQNQGYVVRAVNRGAHAMEAAAQFKPDLVVLDVMMPGVDGWEVLARLRANPSTERVPVIMLTAKDSEPAKVKGFSLGADDYVTKPFGLQELRCRIGAVLRRAHAEETEEEPATIPVVVGGSGFDFVRCKDIFYVEGIRNYSYIHTFDARFLSRLALGAVEERGVEGFMRVHRSYVVNLEHVRGCKWVTKYSYSLRLGDLDGTQIPVSRTLVPEVQRHLGIRS